MDYFNNLFGEPELIKRENWDGKEEPITKDKWQILTKNGTSQQWPFWSGSPPVPELTPEVYKQLGLEPPTIDIDFEVVD